MDDIMYSSLILVISAIVGLISYVLAALAIYKIAKVEKVTNAWLAWVPLVNIYMLLKVAGGKMIFLALGMASFFTGSTFTYLANSRALVIVGTVISIAWSIYGIMMYSRLCERYNVSIAFFIAGLIAPITVNIEAIKLWYVPLLLIGFYGHFALYRSAAKGPKSGVRVESKIVFSSNKKRKKKK